MERPLATPPEDSALGMLRLTHERVEEVWRAIFVGEGGHPGLAEQARTNRRDIDRLLKGRNGSSDRGLLFWTKMAGLFTAISGAVEVVARILQSGG